MDDYYQEEKTNENLQNPKNRFLFLFCHANEVDESWGCGCSFANGVMIFSICVGFTILCDIYYIAADKMFSRSNIAPIFTTMLGVKVASDFITLIGIIMACYAIHRPSYNFGIYSYYVQVLSFLLCTIFCCYCLVEIFNETFFNVVYLRVISWGFNEFALLMLCWILFCNMVYNAKKLQLARQQAGEV